MSRDATVSIADGQDIDLSKMSVEDLEKLARAAQQHKRERKTDPVKVKGYADSVQKHVNGLLRAVQKMNESEGVSPERWKQVETQLARVQLSVYRVEAEKQFGGRSRRSKQ